MGYTKIAKAKPFEGVPRINMPLCYGASPKKPILFKIPVIGQRPMTYKAINLPEGLELSEGIVRGQIENEGDYVVTLIAENALGQDRVEITLEITSVDQLEKIINKLSDISGVIDVSRSRQ